MTCVKSGRPMCSWHPGVWEQISADVHARMLDANRLSQKIFERGVKAGTEALEQGRRSWFADAFLYNTLRDRLGFSNVRAAATGGAALGPETFKFFLAMGRAASPALWADRALRRLHAATSRTRTGLRQLRTGFRQYGKYASSGRMRTVSAKSSPAIPACSRAITSSRKPRKRL